ncbi:MAG: sigma-70 family RNA polymerase sigma factor [Anaerolineales bacterium]|jgi:RNA polymerase sigma-70 factor (ECF subfamily)
MDETALIEDALKGDLEAFNRLVLAYQDMVYNQAYRMMGESDSAADATQEAFISAFKKLHTYRGGSFRAWLLRIVTNACYDEFRRRKRRPTVPLKPQDDYGEEIETPSWLTDDHESPEDTLERADLSEAIQSCLDKLSPNFRAVVVLVDVQGLDYADAASAMNSPIGTVKSRLARARNQLQECLQTFRELLPLTYRLEDEASL